MAPQRMIFLELPWEGLAEDCGCVWPCLEVDFLCPERMLLAAPDAGFCPAEVAG